MCIYWCFVSIEYLIVVLNFFVWENLFDKTIVWDSGKKYWFFKIQDLGLLKGSLLINTAFSISAILIHKNYSLVFKLVVFEMRHHEASDFFTEG